MPRRAIWSIDMGNGVWSVCCMRCRSTLFRGAKRAAARVARNHRCA
jgi:hypothetical protein